MKTVQIRGVNIGEGMPKICVPLVGRTKDGLLQEAEELCKTSADIAEWRADWFDEVYDSDKVEEVLKELRDILGSIPLLFTFRTLKEGGEKDVEPTQYAVINEKAVATGCIDLLDVELFTGDRTVEKLIGLAHECGVKVIASNHDFKKTPAREEMLRRLRRMQEMGADICKLAVMPETMQDVLELLSVTEEMTRQYAECPVITMSMAEKGIISRVCGEFLGSAVTFGAVKKASAPGQLGVAELKTVLEILHESRGRK